MPFQLQVEFSGPCLYILDTPVETKRGRKTLQSASRIGVVMPDCRLTESGKKLKHLDDTPAEPHVGYLRLDLGDIDPRIPRGDEQKGPKYELVHRFTGQVLRFAEADAQPVDTTALKVPNFENIGPHLVPRSDLFGSDAPGVLMRTVLQGGRLHTEAKVPWKFSRAVELNGKEHRGRFASSVTWIRDFPGDQLTVAVTQIGGADEATFLLKDIPDGAVVRMNVANVCAFNPLEWKELPLDQHTLVDEDFKWLYPLFADVPRVAVLPAPVVDRGASNGETGDDGCMGGRTTGPVPPA